MATPNDLQSMQPLDLIRALRYAGRAGEARALCAQLARLEDPGCFIGQLGIDLSFLGMHAEAETLLERALVNEALNLNVRYALLEELCMVQFILGKYHEASANYRVIRSRAFSDAFYHLILESNHVWRDALPHKLLEMDEPVAGMRVFVHSEGGFGDFVQFSRYIDALLRDGAKEVVAEYFPGWESVFRQSKEVKLSLATERGRADGIQRSDRVTFGFSLYARYQRSPYFPAENPSARIAIDPAKKLSDEAAARLDADTRKRKVGLVWHSASGVRQEPYRSIPLARLESVLGDRNCQFYSLQVGAISEQDRAIMNQHGVTDLAPFLSSFGDTARVIEKLDLLITIDTGTAHLAGALNRPVWTLLSQACDCRWLDCRRFTPWYPSMRLYRQTELGDWTQPLAALRADLAKLSACATPARAGNP
jgi:hypothetical protein